MIYFVLLNNRLTKFYEKVNWWRDFISSLIFFMSKMFALLQKAGNKALVFAPLALLGVTFTTGGLVTFEAADISAMFDGVGNGIKTIILATIALIGISVLIVAGRWIQRQIAAKASLRKGGV